MKNKRTLGKLAVVLSIVALMSVATAAPVIPAAPDAGTISTGSGVQVWNGHNCPANVPVNIAGLEHRSWGLRDPDHLAGGPFQLNPC